MQALSETDEPCNRSCAAEPSAPKSTPKHITDLPNEILAQVFRLAIPESSWGNEYFAIKHSCMRSEKPTRRSVCSQPWTRQLRLICRSFENLITPIIGSQIEVTMTSSIVGKMNLYRWVWASSQPATLDMRLLSRAVRNF
jgi:hypothetical protein